MTYDFACTKRKDIDIDAARERVRELRNLIARLGNVNLDAPAQFDEIKERFDYLEHQKQDLQEAGIKVDLSPDINRDTFIKWSFISAMAVTGAYYDVPMGEVQNRERYGIHLSDFPRKALP